ncbi:MAG: short-chain dehydrogenase [Acidimicrobiales bacterium]|nr:MAG: short-chain dehydrogenase [Acidimicrobiales bacterium]
MRNAVGSVQSALVIGGTSDIAAATCRELVERGCRRLLLAGRDEAALEVTAAELRHLGGEGTRVDILGFDAVDFASHEALVDKAFSDGDVDLVLFALGVLGSSEEFWSDPDAAVRAVEVNFTSGVSLLLRCAARMRSQGHGELVVLSSVAAERVRKSNFVYGASKAGLDGFALGLGDALEGSGVHVTVVRPGFVRTKMTAGMREAPLAVDPERVARDVVAALERGDSIVWSPRTLRPVMSVVRHLPRPLFRRLPF